MKHTIWSLALFCGLAGAEQRCPVTQSTEFYAGLSATYMQVKGSRSEALQYTGLPAVYPLGTNSINKSGLTPGIIIGWLRRCPRFMSGFEAGFQALEIKQRLTGTNAGINTNIVDSGTFSYKQGFFARVKYGSVMEKDWAFYGVLGARYSQFRYQCYVQDFLILGGALYHTYAKTTSFNSLGIEGGVGIERKMDALRVSLEATLSQFKQKNITCPFPAATITFSAKPRILQAALHLTYAFKA